MKQLVLAAFLACAVLAANAAQKVLRIPFLAAETNFDPVFVSDLYSNSVTMEIFEAPLTYDFLARPMKLKPQVAEAMPEVSADGLTYTIRLRKGVFYSDDPVFGGRKRELTAADFEFAIKRLVDPKSRSPNLWLIEDRIAGVREANERAKKDGKFDYKVLYILAMPQLGGQAQEVVEKYGDDIGAHPVGTGAYRLAEWRRASRIV